MKPSTIARIRAHAAGKGPEAETAKAILESLGETADISEEIIDVEVKVSGWSETELFANCCFYLDIECLSYKDKRMKGHFARGTKSACSAAIAIFEKLKPQLAEVLKGSTFGFILGALPRPPRPSNAPAAECTPEFLAAARGAVGIGRSNQPRRLLKGT